MNENNNPIQETIIEEIDTDLASQQPTTKLKHCFLV